MLTTLLDRIKEQAFSQQKTLAVLIDPDKVDADKTEHLLENIPPKTDYLMVGGSCVEDFKSDTIVKIIKRKSSIPVILFPGNINQITTKADAILFLSLLSGDNPEYLIHQHVKSVKHLKDTKLEIIPTAYILIDGGKTAAVERVSQTQAIPQNEIQHIIDTAKAGEYLGKQLIYLEAGSGARFPVKPEIIKAVKANINLPLLVGGGIKTEKQRQTAYKAGADMVVMGTVFEDV